jgi:hypothetical protein
MKGKIRPQTTLIGLLFVSTLSLLACGEQSKMSNAPEKATNISADNQVNSPKKPTAASAKALQFVGSFMMCVPDGNNKWYGHFQEFNGTAITAFDGSYSDSDCKTPSTTSSLSDAFTIKKINYASRPSNVSGVFEIDVDGFFSLIGVVDNTLRMGDEEGGTYDGSSANKRPRKLAPLDQTSRHIKIQESILEHLPK